MWLFDLFFSRFCKSDISRYGYLEVFQRVPWTLITRVDCLSRNISKILVFTSFSWVFIHSFVYYNKEWAIIPISPFHIAMDTCSAEATISNCFVPSEKGTTTKGKDNASKGGSTCFPFIRGSLSEENLCADK